MAEVIFEILLFSAYLSAALISVVIAVYAIAVSYLGRETSRSIWLLRKRQMKLKERIREFEDKIDVGKMENEIRGYRQEEASLKDKLLFLSYKGAVLLPLAALLLSLFFSLVGMYVYQWHSNQSNSYFVASLSANAVGVSILLKVLKTVEWAALRIPLPSFEVFFVSWLKEEKIMITEKGKLQLLISNKGDIMAENVDVFVFFPADFKVTPKIDIYRVIKQSKRSDHPSYNAVIFTYDRIHTNINLFSPEIDIEAPKKPHRYKIPIRIHERNIGISEHELVLEVVD